MIKNRFGSEVLSVTLKAAATRYVHLPQSLRNGDKRCSTTTEGASYRLRIAGFDIPYGTVNAFCMRRLDTTGSHLII